MTITPASNVESRISQRTAAAASAEALAASRCKPRRNPTLKMSAFETSMGRQFAIDRIVQGIQVWTMNLPAPAGLGERIPYPASRPRHGHLASQAPALATGKEAVLWKLPDLGSLQRLLDWYEKA